ncbi:MAG: TIGR04076 family protein [Erysipelotrichaceae bacterium]|nr:TIGR04076 family protein [Erysipelotrichaceae bacterium]
MFRKRRNCTARSRNSSANCRRIHIDDTFELYDLKVETVATERPFVCSHREGEYFLVEGENLVFPENRTFSMYALSALLPLLAAKQRVTDRNDWMYTDGEIACPEGEPFELERTVGSKYRNIMHMNINEEEQQ